MQNPIKNLTQVLGDFMVPQLINIDFTYKLYNKKWVPISKYKV